MYWVTQENSIEIPLQSSLSYILLPMVCAHYCAPYPNWPCVEHEANMYYPCYIILLILDPFTKFSYISWSILWLCHQIVTDVTLWPINPNPSYSKNWKLKNKLKIKIKNKRKNKINQVHFLQSWQVVHFVIYILSENIKNRGVRIENNGLGFYFIFIFLLFFYFLSFYLI